MAAKDGIDEIDAMDVAMELADAVQLVWRVCRKVVCEAVRPPVEGAGEGDAAQSVPSKPHATLLQEESHVPSEIQLGGQPDAQSGVEAAQSVPSKPHAALLQSESHMPSEM